MTPPVSGLLNIHTRLKNSSFPLGAWYAAQKNRALETVLKKALKRVLQKALQRSLEKVFSRGRHKIRSKTLYKTVPKLFPSLQDHLKTPSRALPKTIQNGLEESS